MHLKYDQVKRIFDLILALSFLIFFSPLILFLILLLYFTQGRPIFIFQKRSGYKNKPLNVLKLRTMIEKRIDKNLKLDDDQRVTKIGYWLRKLSLDELPQIYNIIKGEMSFIGPRPQLYEYRNLYSQEQLARHNVLPGLSGWAQINGRNTISWERRFELDIWYIKNKNFTLDLKILIITVFKVILMSDISAEGTISMTRFKGKSK